MPEIGQSGSEGGAKIAFVPTPILAQGGASPCPRRRAYGGSEVIRKLGPKLPGLQFWSVSDPRL